MEQVGKNVKRKKIMLPDVKGSIIEFRYVVYSPSSAKCLTGASSRKSL
jgi:hypothetical protein